jgi:hypothetical protein
MNRGDVDERIVSHVRQNLSGGDLCIRILPDTDTSANNKGLFYY